MAFGPFSDDKGTFMQDVLDVNPRAVITQISLIRCGSGSNIELFSYPRPTSRSCSRKTATSAAITSPLCRRHQGRRKYLKSKGVFTLFGPIPIKEGPAAGQSILYFKAPWGLQMEAITYPDGMAYEKDRR